MKTYTDPIKHANFAFCQPTTDSDVVWFYLNPLPNIWQYIDFDYFEITKVSISYVVKDTSIFLKVEMPAEDISTELTSEEIEEIAWQKISIWLNNLQEAQNTNSHPKEVLKYSCLEPFDKTFEFPYQEGMLVGFYTNFWEM